MLALSALRRRALGAVLAMTLGASCLPGPRPPEVAPSGTLGVRGERGGKAAVGPFAVVHASPVGEADAPSEVTVVWSRPMRPLELAGDDESPVPVRLWADGEGRAPKGKWHWLGTQAAAFSPEEPLAPATVFHYEIAAGTKALDGAVLAAAERFEFVTPAPRLLRTEPFAGQESSPLAPLSPITLVFNQPMAPAEVERHVRLELEASGKAAPRAVPVAAKYDKGNDKTRVVVTPRAPLPLDSAVTLVADAALRGTEGPRPAGEERRVEFRTYGPLRVRAMTCYRETPHKKCAARETIGVELTNPVRMRDAVRAISVGGAPITWRGQSARDDDDWVSFVNVPARLEPARPYTLSVRAGLKDQFGQSLAQTVSLPIETDDEWPDFEVGLAGSVFDALKSSPIIPLASVNAKTLDVVAAELDEATYTRFMFPGPRAGLTFTSVADVPSAKRRTLTPGGAPNRRALSTLDLPAVLGTSAERRGLFAFAVRGPAERGGMSDRVHTVNVTDLGITAKMSHFGSLVWVTSLANGKPQTGVTVSIRRRGGEEVFAQKTDADGLVRIPADRYDPATAIERTEDDALVFARLGDDVSVRRVRDMLSPWRFVSASDPEGRLDPIGFIFIDRGVYRPGETLRAKGLFRVPTARGTDTPRGRPIVVRGFEPQGEQVFEKEVKLGEFGDFAVDVPIPASAHLGTFELRAEWDTAKKDRHGRSDGVVTATAELAAYKASEFKVAVEPDRPAYVRGDRATVTTRGDYLFGAPMAGGKARVSVRRGPGWFDLPLGAAASDSGPRFAWDDETYLADRPERSPRAGVVTSAEGALGARGELVTPVTLALPEVHGTEVLRIESEVEDLTRQTVATEASALVHPAEFYVALARAGDAFAEAGARVSTRVLAVEPSGKRRAGVAVEVQLLRRTWSNVLRGAGESGVTNESRVVDEIVGSCAVTTTIDGAGCDLTTKASGYHVIRATARDPRGNAVAASQSLYVLDKGDGASEPRWRATDGAALDLVLDKKAYEVGETATVLVKSPYPEAEALVTVERAGVMRTERRTLRGATPTLKIPITEDMNPNAFVGVHLLRGRTKARAPRGADVGAPSFRLGYAEIPIRPDARRLRVKVTPSTTEARPGQELEVEVAVADRAGKPVRASATLYAVDEGVLMLTGYKTPDPLPRFAAPRPLAVFSLESREDLARVFRLSPVAPGEDKGRDGGGGGSGMRADFRATAYFEPSLLVENGRAKARFKLPDGLTTYRVMAVVADAGDRFGFAEASVVTSRKLMLRPALPRFVRAGDFVDAGVIVTAKSLPKTEVDVDLAATGLEIEGPARVHVSLDAGGQAEVRFRMRAPRAGKATLAFRATTTTPGVRETDALSIQKDVAVPTAIEAVALAGTTDGAAAEALGDLAAVRPDVGNLELGLSSSALVGVDGVSRQLLEYPYGCTEQLTSRLVPLVLAAELLPFVGAAPPPDAGRIVDETVGKILKAQRPDGSFGYWTDSHEGNAWLTSYVTWALHESKRRGHAVPAGALEAAAAAVRKYARASVVKGGLGASEAAFAADVLASVGTPDGALMTAAFGERAQMPLFARALLAHAYAVAGAKSIAAPAQRDVVAELVRDLDSHVKPTPTGALVVDRTGPEYEALLDSDTRTTAMVLRALVAIRPDHPLVGRLARGLVGAREGGVLRSTQEAGWALVALSDFRRAVEHEPTSFEARVFFGDTLVKSAQFTAPSTSTASVPLADLLAGGPKSAVTFQLLGTGRLYYEARLRYARKELPTTALDRGFFVKKTMRAVRPDALAEALRTTDPRGTSAFAGGDLVLVDLHVIATEPRRQVVVDDPLPAGLEAMDTRLATTGAAARAAAEGGSGDEDGEEGDDRRAQPSHREVHDDRVLLFFESLPAGVFHARYLARATARGRYLLPPTRAECMYEPEVFGRTAGQVVEVR